MNPMLLFSVAAAASLFCGAVESRGVRVKPFDVPFVPATAPKARASAKLDVLKGRNMPFVAATLEGRKCNLLFDTGATHTTFDIGFVRRELPEAKLEAVVLAGATNVEGAPRIFRVGSMKLGDAEFGGFSAMALDISHLVPGIGAKVDGIVGMNVIGRVPSLVSLGSGEVVFAPGQDDLAGFGKGIARSVDDPFSVAVAPSYGGKRFALIVDSASSLTFLGRSLGWPSSGKAVNLGAVEVNGSTSLAVEAGLAGKLSLGEEVEVSPLLFDEPVGRIGADTLLRYDMLVDASQARFRKREKAQAPESRPKAR